MSKISIVIPVYYNADTLMLLYEDMKAKILGVLGDYELVFVDDGSFPETSASMRPFWRALPSVPATAP